MVRISAPCTIAVLVTAALASSPFNALERKARVCSPFHKQHWQRTILMKIEKHNLQ
jgi:hypothetical protein